MLAPGWLPEVEMRLNAILPGYPIMDDSPPAESPFTVYPVPVDGHVPVDEPGLRVHAVAPDPPSHV
jgi:hypothetical protein